MMWCIIVIIFALYLYLIHSLFKNVIF